jgi:hypothetical protein
MMKTFVLSMMNMMEMCMCGMCMCFYAVFSDVLSVIQVKRCLS